MERSVGWGEYKVLPISRFSLHPNTSHWPLRWNYNRKSTVMADVILFFWPQTFHSQGITVMSVSWAQERNNEKQVTVLKASWNQLHESLTALQKDALSMCKGNLKEYKCSKPIQVMSGVKDVSRWDMEEPLRWTTELNLWFQELQTISMWEPANLLRQDYMTLLSPAVWFFSLLRDGQCFVYIYDATGLRWGC